MNKKGKVEYSCSNRQSTRREIDKMFNNMVHDREYTFADQYYEELQEDYYAELLKDLKEEQN